MKKRLMSMKEIAEENSRRISGKAKNVSDKDILANYKKYKEENAALGARLTQLIDECLSHMRILDVKEKKLNEKEQKLARREESAREKKREFTAKNKKVVVGLKDIEHKDIVLSDMSKALDSREYAIEKKFDRSVRMCDKAIKDKKEIIAGEKSIKAKIAEFNKKDIEVRVREKEIALRRAELDKDIDAFNKAETDLYKRNGDLIIEEAKYRKKWEDLDKLRRELLVKEKLLTKKVRK